MGYHIFMYFELIYHNSNNILTHFQVSLSPLWEAERYNEERHNCFTFVLAFLRALDCGELSEKAHDPKLFCKQYVVPRTSAAGKYISLYRQLKRQNYFIQNQ